MRRWLGRHWRLAGAVLVMSCAPSGGGSGGEPQGNWPEVAGASATVEGVAYTLDVEAWRSFQPVVGDAGEPMLAVVRLSSAQPISADLALARVRARRGSESWVGVLREESPRAPNATTVEFMLRDGPRWAAGDSIQVMVELVRRGSPLAVLGVQTAIARVS